MAALYKTQCPHCAAKFRISDQHLKQAKGAVRCGSCMLVFQASEHLTPIQAGAVKPPIRPSQPAPPDWQHLDLSNAETITKTTGAPTTEFGDTFLDTDTENDDFLYQESFVSQDHTNIDDSWAEELLRELKEDTSPALTQHDTNLPEDTLTEEEDTPQTTEATSDSEEEAHEEPVEDWLNEGLLDELLMPEPVSESAATAPTAPLFSKPGINWAQQVKWGVLTLLLLVVLGAQYLYVNFHSLARSPEHRPKIAFLCEYLGCQLPSMSNLNRIRSQHLVVRTHPEYEDALQVDALIYNLAEYEQPFPNIGLEFSDQQGNVVASRLFTPSEYLSGSLKEATMMPPSVPVRLSLTLENPSSDAHNHRMRFYSPDEPNSP